MALSTAGWHQRYTQQAAWTKNLRDYLYPRAGLQNARRVLDLGCGTGVLAGDLAARAQAQVHCLDIDLGNLRFARQNVEAAFTQADGQALPYASDSFDLALTHFVLLWVDDPVRVVREMARVVRLGGAVLALAEPDYGGRVDYPPDLARLGEMQRVALEGQGADPLMGRKLAKLFTAAGLENVETGVLGAQWSGLGSGEDWESEWRVLAADLAGRLPHAELDRLKKVDEEARQKGERVLYVPTFYAWGRK